MARIPDGEVERLKSEVSLARLIEAEGLTLQRTGKDLACRCPFHEGDDTPSLLITPGKNLFHCFACGAAGSPIDWVMRRRGVSFRHAVEWLRAQAGLAEAEPLPAADAAERLAPLVPDADDQRLLNEVTGFYHATLKDSPEALAYLAKRGLTHPDLIAHFRLGFANRTLAYRLPAKQLVAGAALRGRLQRLGLIRVSGHEHFNGSLVIPVHDLAGDVVEVYGRKITPRLREGTPLHLYLPGPHRGVFNLAGWKGSEEVILCEALIDALTFWGAGYRHVTSSFGVGGFTDEILQAFVVHGVKRVLIAYDRDEAGDQAALKLAPRLNAQGIEAFRVLFPKGMDANDYALHVTPPAKALGVALRSAEWLGKGRPVPALAVQESESVPAVIEASAPEIFPLAADPAPEPAPTPSAPPAPDAEDLLQGVALASPVPPAARTIDAEIKPHEVVIPIGDRRYRVRGLEKNLSYEQLRVNLHVTREGMGELGRASLGYHVDTLDVYNAKQRTAFLNQAGAELGLEEAVLKSDLGQVLSKLEALQDAQIQKALAPKPEVTAAALSPEQTAAALALLRDPDLLSRIQHDVEAIGVVGEGANALVAYLACVSRKLDKPLAILIQSTSAAGKSTLMDAVLSLLPEDDRVHYSAMTGQSLFYLGEHSMQHKVLAIAEEEGVRQAAYALKLLQSQGELTIASTGKDPATGQLVTQEYRVQGPVMLFLTTTAIDIDEELLNRCLVLTINETREQTEAIHRAQRAARTLNGVLSAKSAAGLRELHHAAQRLLAPVTVVNPYAEQLRFDAQSTRTRRDHQKYLTLIESIAFVHQHQREQKTVEHQGQVLRYIEVTPEDIAMANRLAHDVLGRSLDELPPQTRRLLEQTLAYVQQRAQREAIAPSAVRFTRRELREALGWRYTQLVVHAQRLEALEYLLPHRGRVGQTLLYELAYRGEGEGGESFVLGLIEAGALRDDDPLSVSGADLSGACRLTVGPLSPGCRAVEMPGNARPDTVISSLAAAVAETARPGPGRASHRNGASYPQPGASA